MMWVPHTTMLGALEHHRPDVMFFTGDQIYQGVPTQVQPPPCPADDFLYKWLHWVDSYRRLTRRIPTVVQTDDHNVYQGNIWGWSGRKCPSQRNSDGGYIYSPEFVNMVERWMCAGNPDPYDPRPIQRGIGVYFCSFKYGGVSFAVLEDRKFKTPKSVPQEEGVLLGPRRRSSWPSGGGTGRAPSPRWSSARPPTPLSAPTPKACRRRTTIPTVFPSPGATARYG